MNLLDIVNVTFGYGRNKTPIVQQFSFSMKRGEIVGLLGPSGRGKSTILRLIAGLEVASSGEIRLSGRTVCNDKTFIAPERRGVGMVFQDYALFPHLTVGQNIEFGLHRMSGSAKKARAKEMLELVQLQGYESRYPHELSGGQQQRVALARSLAPKPELLLMDEPFSNLDEQLKDTIRLDLSGILRRADMSCILVTHDRHDAQAICDRIVQLP